MICRVVAAVALVGFRCFDFRSLRIINREDHLCLNHKGVLSLDLLEAHFRQLRLAGRLAEGPRL